MQRRGIFLKRVLQSSLVVAVLLLGLPAAALAHEGNTTLQVSPEVSTIEPGESVTLKAKLETGPVLAEQDPGGEPTVAPADTPVTFLLENNAGTTPVASKLSASSCTVKKGESSCSVIFTATGFGSTRVRAHISDEPVDDAEGRYSDPTFDCTEEDDETTCNAGTPVPGDDDPPFEPDYTDVVVVNHMRFIENVDCSPETAPASGSTLKAGSTHTISCTYTEYQEPPGARRGVAGETLYLEITGAGDPDRSDSPESPDGTCQTVGNNPTTQADETGTCTFTHSSREGGQTQYRIWAEDENAAAPDSPDVAEGQDETSAPGNAPEPDATDVVVATFTAAQAEVLTLTPETGAASMGSCFPYTATVTNTNGVAVPSMVIDVEQFDDKAGDNIADNELLVGFCTPPSGPNPSQVDSTKGDLGTASTRNNPDPSGTNLSSTGFEDPDNRGTMGGETVKPTDANGQVTFGITARTANGSPSSSIVTVLAFLDRDGDDDPDADQAGTPATNEFEIRDSSRHTWLAAEARSVDCEPESGASPINTEYTIECTVRDGAGTPVANEGVTFTEEGPGTIVGSSSGTTDNQGRTVVRVTSQETGVQTVTGTLTDDVGAGEPTQVDECDRAANDPAGAGAGTCSDSVTVTWTPEGGRTIECQPSAATTSTGTNRTFTCVVRDASGQPAANRSVTFSESGPGEITSALTRATNNAGEATVTVASSETGTQSITATITDDLQGNEPSQVDDCDREAGDPTGSQSGECSDTVTNTWVQGPSNEPECKDGADNDGDGTLDHPNDPGCSSPEDDDESGDPPPPAECADGDDNDGDGDVDSADPGCSGAADDDESDDPVEPTCPGYEDDPRNQVVGTEGDETLTGTEGDDVICGLGGADLIDGLGGNDVILGGEGNDSIRGGDGNDSLFGEAGEDSVRGNDGDDVLRGGDDNDDLRGNAGSDLLYGQSGFDAVRGGDGSDEVYGGSGNDVLAGGKGGDKIRGNKGRDTCTGGPGRDDIKGCED